MQYWLVKSEPSCYSIQDLKRDKVTAWNDVRNYQARNFLRTMKKGDQVLFYHSSCDLVGVVGEATVVKEAYSDPTQFDPNSEGYDTAATIDNPRWSTVDVKFLRMYKEIVTLKQLKADTKLHKMTLLKPGNRLSVMSVTEGDFFRVQMLVTK